MNSATAELLLSSYREGQRLDPRTEKALRVAETEAALRHKLSAQKDFDAQLVEVIHCLAPPEDLRQKLLDLPTPARGALRANLRQPAILAAIAGVLLIIGFLVYLSFERMDAFPGREALERMLAATTKMSGVEFEPAANVAGEFGDWFYMHGYESYSLRPELAPLRAVGSRVFHQDGHAIAQVAIDAHDSIAYVFRPSDFGVHLEDEADWRVFEYEDWAAAVRQQGDCCCMLAFRGSEDEMRSFIDSLQEK